MTKKGINGWLSAEGEFLECESGEHGKTALLEGVEYNSQWIHISSVFLKSGNTYDSVVGFFLEPTAEQWKFIKENMGKFDEVQLKDIEKAKEDYNLE